MNNQQGAKEMRFIVTVLLAWIVTALFSQGFPMFFGILIVSYAVEYFMNIVRDNSHKPVK